MEKLLRPTPQLQDLPVQAAHQLKRHLNCVESTVVLRTVGHQLDGREVRADELGVRHVALWMLLEVPVLPRLETAIHSDDWSSHWTKYSRELPAPRRFSTRATACSSNSSSFFSSCSSSSLTRSKRRRFGRGSSSSSSAEESSKPAATIASLSSRSDVPLAGLMPPATCDAGACGDITAPARVTSLREKADTTVTSPT
uniref:Uncharacterized protein n=1 Tax=Globisporangium ultimum (strain ATCC 200006 / CBS 805.95 / DAOM BR144) TaxID=431595 RepID=K3XDL9_GLOUD